LLTLLAQAPDGLRADQVAQALGKSPSTAYNLLDTLCQEGFVIHEGGAAYRLAADAAALVPRADAEGHAPLASGLVGIIDTLFARTRKRVYLAAASSGKIVIPLARGRQGMPRIPGLRSRIGSDAHALALGKVALSLAPEAALERYIAAGLRSFTAETITDEAELREQLADIRGGAIAHDREEFSEDFCCLATPVRNAQGRAVAVLGISMSARCFEVERGALEATLRDVAAEATFVLGAAAVPAISEDQNVLEAQRRADLTSAANGLPQSSASKFSIGEEFTS
jgi:DNA-binding IclR family transcriptional regulator